MCYYIQKDRMIILLETSDKCRNDQCPTPKECKGTNMNYKTKAKPTQKNKKNGLATS
jgi:hypothetical protein